MTTVRHRIIPALLIQDRKLVKTCRFDKPRYVGDPINAVKIFNDKEVDELIILDISATRQKRGPDIKLIAELASECFMPFCYGGGVSTLDQVKQIFDSGVEKVAFNTSFFTKPKLIEDSAKIFGSQAIVAAIDSKPGWFGKYSVYSHCATQSHKATPLAHARSCINLGAGELLLSSIDRDGTYSGYDTNLIKLVTSQVNVPVIALGGAGNFEHLKAVIEVGGASAAAAGSLFVFHGKHKAVLINVPKEAFLSSSHL